MKKSTITYSKITFSKTRTRIASIAQANGWPDAQDHHPANGHIQFAHGTPSGYSQTNFMVKPQVGDFYIFPAELFHCVYPFKTKGERRSFSVNFTFVEVPKETVDKQ